MQLNKGAAYRLYAAPTINAPPNHWGDKWVRMRQPVTHTLPCCHCWDPPINRGEQGGMGQCSVGYTHWPH